MRQSAGDRLLTLARRCSRVRADADDLLWWWRWSPTASPSSTPVSEAPGGWSADLLDPDGFGIGLYQSGDTPRAEALDTFLRHSGLCCRFCGCPDVVEARVLSGR